MFTGLVQHCGRVDSRAETASGLRLVVAVGAWPPADAPSLSLGESIAVNGCCLTLVSVATTATPATPATPATTVAQQAQSDSASSERRLSFDLIPQTLRVTAMGTLAVGDPVNLERSATPATLLGGHLVQGHVDGLGHIDQLLTDDGEWRLRVRPPRDLLRYIHERGSIAIDGVSLTVARLDDASGTFDVCLIPETLARTNLATRLPGHAVQLEADCIAKMVERSLAARQASGQASH